MANIEEQMKIAPHVTEQIFDYLDIRCLVKCRAISKSWKLFIEKSRFSSVKMIKAIGQQLQPSVEIQSQWNRFLLIADNKKIRTALRWLNEDTIDNHFSPLLVLSKMQDSLELYKDICKTCKGDVSIIFLLNPKKPGQGILYPSVLDIACRDVTAGATGATGCT